MRSLLAAIAAAALSCAAASSPSEAQGQTQPYPTKPIRLVLPYPAGGGTDVLARLVAQNLSDRLGQPIVVENRTGASGSIGTDFVIKSPPDGYTLLFNNETLVVAPSIAKNLPYDATRDLTPLGLVAKSVIVIGVHSDMPAKSLPELVALAKAAPGKLAYSTCGNATIMHFAGEQLKLAASIDMTHVPYRGCAPAMQDSASGQVPVFVNALTNAVNLEKQGRVRILAVASRQRSSLAPTVPTVAEQGFPNFDATPFQALYAPPGLPADIAKRLSTELRDAVASPELDERIRAMSFEPAPSSPEELSALLRDDIVRWAQVAKAAKIEAE
jgi:tripartite-type tricarboxylate transporter receptor subunit TctC